VEDFMAVNMRANDACEFVTNWEAVLSGMAEKPADELLEVLLLTQLRTCSGMSYDLAEYDRKPPGSPEHCCEYLYSALKRMIGAAKRGSGNTRSEPTE